MERKNIRIRRDEILRIKFIKREHSVVILQSIMRSRHVANMIRFYSAIKLQKKNVFMGRSKNVCILTGRARGTSRYFNISRHMLNKIGQQGDITGFTRNNIK
jgi:ribosomal protein S14